MKLSPYFPFQNQKYCCLLFLLLLLISSCTSVQKTYIPIQAVPHFFEQKGDQTISLQANFNEAQLQYGRAMGDKWGISSIVYGGFQGQRSASISAVRYQQFNPRWYGELSGGYRFVNNFSDIEKAIGLKIFFIPALYQKDLLTQHKRIVYHELPIQADVILLKKSTEKASPKLGFSLQGSPIWFKNFHIQTTISEGGCDICYLNYRSHILTKNRWGVTISPSMTYWFSIKKVDVNVRSGISFISIFGDPIYSDYRFTYPETASFFLQAGIQLTHRQ